MSRLLRRIKRSRTAADGEQPAEQQAAGMEAADATTPTGGATAPAGDEARTAQLPAATVPLIRADPDRPAGLEEEAASAPPAGRRGRLRRRLRYLRRARELMLRDLGGLVYEVHRSGAGDYAAHGGVIGGKVERLARLDDEAGAIEHALGTARSAAVVFEPGIGGTCEVCGELYGSSARFCSHCGASTDPAARAAAAPAGTAAGARPVPPMPKAPDAGKRGLFGRRKQAEPAAAAATVPPPEADAPTAEEAPAARPEEAKPAEEEKLFSSWPDRPGDTEATQKIETGQDANGRATAGEPVEAPEESRK